MKTDRELLELAAKASCIEFEFCRIEIGGCLIKINDVQKWWNPLTDDGDALRLAVKLMLDIAISKVVQVSWFDGYDILQWVEEPEGEVRRAIVRAAAAIGESMND